MTEHPPLRWSRVYVSIVVAAGFAAILESFYQLFVNPIPWDWTILALLTLFSGSVTVKLPSVPATISISETFVFTSVLLFGASAGTLTVALDALVISYWLARKGHPFYRVLFNVGALPLAIWLAAHLFYSLSDVKPLATVQQPAIQVSQLALPLFVFTVAYFLLNSWLIAFAISSEKGLSPFRVWRDNFVLLSLNYFGGASVAALLVSYTRSLDFTYFAIIVPLLLILYLTYATSMGRVADADRHLTQLNSLYLSTIETLAMAIDAKDQITHGHIRRVQLYAIELARAVGVRDDSQMRAIEAAALLHDMGKLAVPEYILNKPGPLTHAEFEKMKLHASVGADILSAISFPYPVVPIVRHHHENWDGTGYPDRLRGADIPIGARILSVVDCFDALTSDRPYRPRLSDPEAIRILLERRGAMYDPLVVDTFVRIHPTLSVHDSPLLNHGNALSAITDAARPGAQIAQSNARFEDIAASAEEMLTLYDLARALSGPIGLSDAADVIAKHLRRVIPASTCVFYTYDVDCDELVVGHASGENAGAFQGLRVSMGQRLSGWVAANRQTIINSDPVLDLGEAARSLNPRPRSCLSTPLVFDGRLVGVLTLYAAAREAFTDDHRRIVEVVTRQVALTVHHAIHSDRARVGRYRDNLTGLPNQERLRYFVRSAMAAADIAAPLSILIIDISASRTVVRHSKQPGADVVSDLIAAVRQALRGADILFRYDTDEFVVALSQTDRRTAATVAARIRVSVEAGRHGTAAMSAGDIRIGVASAPEDGSTLEQLISAAKRRFGTTDSSSESSDRGSIH